MWNAATSLGLLLFSLAVLLPSFTNVNAGKFVDDTGREFDFVGKPKLATRAGVGALSLYRMGARQEITSVFGLWSIRGSDLDVENPEAGSRYPESDPSPEEVRWLQTKNNLSPGCYTNPRGCSRWDNLTIVEEYKDEIDYILYIDNGNDGNMLTITNETGIPVVFIDTFFDYHIECRPRIVENDFEEGNKTKCFGRSMIDIAKRIEELAVALGIDMDTKQIEKDKQHLCESAQTFTETMKKKQSEGLRVMTSINAVKIDDDGNNFFEIRTLDPINLWVPRTLEELGMPILHHDENHLTMENISTRVTGDEFFLDCPTGELSEDCNDNTMYPVDFWLFDSRSYLSVLGNEQVLKSIFPDKAILAGQHWHYARNDGPVSYYAIYRMLDEMTKRIDTAERMHNPTECTPIDPKTAVTAQEGGGLDRNQYICYNEELIQTEYLQVCLSDSVSPPDFPLQDVSPSDSISTDPLTSDSPALAYGCMAYMASVFPALLFYFV